MFSECKDTEVKTIQNEAQKNANHKNNEMNKSKNKKNMYRASVTCETIKQSNICVVGILEKLPSKKDV